MKYFWQDLIQNKIKNNDDKKKILVQRLNSVNVNGFGISKLGSETLENYAWVALSRLIPLIWQPVINYIDLFTVHVYILIPLLLSDIF